MLPHHQLPPPDKELSPQGDRFLCCKRPQGLRHQDPPAHGASLLPGLRVEPRGPALPLGNVVALLGLREPGFPAHSGTPQSPRLVGCCFGGTDSPSTGVSSPVLLTSVLLTSVGWQRPERTGEEWQAAQLEGRMAL